MFRIVQRPWLGRGTAGVTDREETCTPTGFGLVGIDRHAVVVAAAGMGDVVCAATDRPAVPGIVDVEDERRVDADGGMQRIGRLPGAISHAGNIFSGGSRGTQRQAPAVAGDGMALVVQPRDLDLQPFDRGIDITHRAAATRLLTQHMPGFERMAQLQLDAALGHLAEAREPEFEVRCEPVRREVIPRLGQIGEHVGEVLPDEVRQHEIVMQACAPAAERPLIGAIPELRDQAAQQRLLRHAHAPVRRHLEGAQLQQAATAGGRIRREELVDAEFGAMRIACRIDQQVAEDTIDQPGRCLAAGLYLSEGDLKFVQRIVARLVDSRVLTRRADEQAGEEIGKRGVVEPVAQQALQQVGPAQQR